MNFTPQQRTDLLNNNCWSKNEVRQLIRDCEELETKANTVDTKVKAANGGQIGFRPNKENIDEIVSNDIKCFHLEYIDKNDIWIGMNLENGEQYHIHIQTNKAHIKTWAERIG